MTKIESTPVKQTGNSFTKEGLNEIRSVANKNADNSSHVLGRIFQVGTGSGNLTINGSVIGGGLLADDVVEIVPGTYNVITIQDFNIISGFATVRPQTGRITAASIAPYRLIGAIIENIDLVGGGQSNIRFGGSSALPYKNIIFRGLSFTGATSFSVRHQNPQVYNPSNPDATALQNITFDSNEFVNCPQFQLGGSPNDDTGRVINLVFKNNICRNRNGNYDWLDGEAPDGSSVAPNYFINVTNAENYDFDGNTFYKIMRPENHTAMIFASGWGLIRNNRAEKYRGQLGRQWLYAKESGRATYSYNNLGKDCFKYSLLECQVTSGMSGAANWVASDYYCFFNTAINFGAWEDPDFWQAIVLDNYGIGGANVYFENNLGVNVLPNTGNTSLIWGAAATTNLYNQTFADRFAAKINPQGIPYSDSPIVGQGVQNISYPVLSDIAGTERASPPTIGAYEPLSQPEPDLPTPISSQTEYIVNVGGTETIELTNHPQGAMSQWYAGGPEGTGVFIYEGTDSFSFGPPNTDNPVAAVPVYIRYTQDGYASDYYIITIAIVEQGNFNLTIQINGTSENPDIVYNEEVQPNNTMSFPANTQVNDITPVLAGYTFTPSSMDVLMNSDKLITFTAIPE
ncbi:hypothetical protein [Parapedobacter indicus]|uniref:Uncharacterized protein n=1 Tax=Parapedobacter indicus TaxID=1477437 RepID=A0A1I3QTY5_9SPHI|nr:hypothetical protein [Parapedobacter indicus]PPL00244.1 hypothetical protein CLV26_109122 [Parapedobacter indicus]SFJ37558.1 hypothetical protein SAMN05444682_109122 [Parapedobacter indicus]